MNYKLFHNSTDGTHCVQACLQMVLYATGRPVLSLEELDKITVHDPKKWTWMGDALLWLQSLGYTVTNVENLDYERFATEGESYLRSIWPKNVFEEQKKYSDLLQEQETAKKLLGSGIELVNNRLTLSEIEKYKDHLILLSVNPHVLNGNYNLYGSHLVLIKNFGKDAVTILDPDFDTERIVNRAALEDSINAKNKQDFNVILIGQ